MVDERRTGDMKRAAKSFGDITGEAEIVALW